MQCNELEQELVAYDRGELAPEDAGHVDAHLADCEACRRRLAEIRETMRIVRMGLVAMEPSADFRLRLRERIRRGSHHVSGCSSRRFLTRGPQERRTFAEALRDRMRRSPYLLYSLAAHAAVLLIVVGWAAYAWRAPAEGRPPLDGPQVVRDRAQALRDARITAWTTRVPFADRRVPLARVQPAKAVYVGEDHEDGCLWLYPVGGQGGVGEDAFLDRLPDGAATQFTRVPTGPEGDVVLPEPLTEAFLADAEEVVLVDLRNVPRKERLEVWSAARWESYVKSGHAATLRGETAVILRLDR
ncbi:MAG: zf-HC2 domain-containing protein, partial [Planctomycetota bacterium]